MLADEVTPDAADTAACFWVIGGLNAHFASRMCRKYVPEIAVADCDASLAAALDAGAADAVAWPIDPCELAAPDARFSIMKLKWGIVSDLAGFALWRTTVRDDVLRELTYKQRAARALGFVTRIVIVNEPHAAAMVLARDIAARSPTRSRRSHDQYSEAPAQLRRLKPSTARDRRARGPSMLRLGTRGSPLALVQANLVRDALLAAHGWGPEAVKIVPIRTTGDRVQDRPLAEIGGKALWTKELDRALLAGEIDLAVHSMKDVETIRPGNIAIAAMQSRADVRDRLIGAGSIDTLPRGARIGTGSPRRAAQMRRIRSDLVIVPLRGNVDTRIAKVAAGEADATLLAAAGLDRLGWRDVGAPIALDAMLPAPSQGAVGIEVRADAAATREAIAGIGDRATELCVRAERALLAALHSDCHSPVAALATIDTAGLRLRAELLSEDGGLHVGTDCTGLAGTPEEATAIAHALLAEAPPALRALFGH